MEYFDSITVNNNSPDTIRVLLAHEQEAHPFPDTRLPVQRPALQTVAPGKAVAPGKRGVYDFPESHRNKLRLSTPEE